MLLGSRRRNLTAWCGWRFRIDVEKLEECLYVLDFFIISNEDICVSCRSVDEIIGSRGLNILIYFLHLEVHCLWI